MRISTALTRGWKSLATAAVIFACGGQSPPSPTAVPTMPAAAPAACGTVTAFHALDFWLGSWDVRTADGAFAGRDVVTAVEAGCAVQEEWRDADGSTGRSLFVFDPFAGRWHQVWVTSQATARGGLKFKDLVAVYPDGGVRFQGALPGPAASRVVLDRTTLSPRPDGTVRQVIETSIDGGSTWRVGFDATYRRSRSRSRSRSRRRNEYAR